MAAQPVDLELVLAIDVSRSIDAEEARLQRDGYVGALVNETIIRAVRSGTLGRIAVSYIEWAEIASRTVTVGWTLVDDAASARAFASQVAAAPPTVGFYTSISGAIEFAMQMFADNGYEGTRRVIDISGDGANNNGRLVTTARDRAVAAGITINGLPLINERPSPFGWPPIKDLDLYYRHCVIGGPRAFIAAAEGFDDFAAAIRKKLIIEIAGLSPLGSPRRAAGARNLGPWVGGTPLRLVAQERQPPSCDIGERRIRQRLQNFDGFN